ncbi:MAG: phosphoribosylaminoimidazolesuccinocarboxamide synthase [Cyanobacteria bacterium J06648_16]
MGKWRELGLGLLGWGVAVAPAIANCAGTVGSYEWHQPVLAEHFQQIQARETYPWGTARVYDRLEDRRILLTDAFETLDGPDKRSAIATLLNFDFQDYLTPEEYEQKFTEPGIGPSPYPVVASDGRLVSAAYDGCTRFTLLTERDRFSWYYNDQGRGQPYNLPDELLRNVGAEWRVNNFPITAAAERSVRLGFWNSVGYENRDWWIAWVPEHGYFEVNVPENFDDDRLQRYWQVADRDYRYVVVRADGTTLGKKQF